MNRLLITILLVVITGNVFSQKLFRSVNYNVAPLMTETSNGIWSAWEGVIYDTLRYDSIKVDSIVVNEITIKGAPDSAYMKITGTPDRDDLRMPDLELQIKTLWYGNKVYFLFRHFDDNYVTGYNANGSLDEDLQDGLEHRDAIALYFYFKADQERLDGVVDDDSIAWMRFVLKTDSVEGMIGADKKVDSFADFATEVVQWQEGAYNFTKMAIDFEQLAPEWSTLESRVLGFELELDENDKEYGSTPFEIQTRAFWGNDLGSSALENIKDWEWLFFVKYDDDYISPVTENEAGFAKIFPNPVKDELNLQLTENSHYSYSILDLTGRTIIASQFSGATQSIHVDEFTPGIYLLKVTNKSKESSVLKFEKL